MVKALRELQIAMGVEHVQRMVQLTAHQQTLHALGGLSVRLLRKSLAECIASWRCNTMQFFSRKVRIDKL